ncbi:MAG TPA: CDP-diacylglycerol--serine O-phosphatidyltransferase [Candidatus Binataceae bacterium]|jgi:CDP-diacylglycerol--serine O-phosphatidyltransferase
MTADQNESFDRSGVRIRVIDRDRDLRERSAPGPARRGVFLIPATITSLGLLAGFYSLVSSINGHFELAALLIVVSFVCDGLDGRVARASRASSQFGVELDSLSDMVAFGVAPAGLIYVWAMRDVASWSWVLSGMFVICAALRLARFNVQAGTVDKHRFVGLPVPGAAAVIAGLTLAYSYFEIDAARTICAVSIVLTATLAFLMISRVPYPSFKTLSPRNVATLETMVLILVVVAFVFVMPQLSAFLGSTAYMLSGPVLMLRGERSEPPVPAVSNDQRSASA